MTLNSVKYLELSFIMTLLFFFVVYSGLTELTIQKNRVFTPLFATYCTPAIFLLKVLLC